MTKEIKAYGLGRIRDWLLEEYQPGVHNLTKILSEPLLEELISYNDDVNADRVFALIQVMIYRDQLYRVSVRNNVEDNEREQRNLIFSAPIFAQSWIDGGASAKGSIFPF
jgi:hypothetical protein